MGKKNRKSNNNGKQPQDLQDDNSSEEGVEINQVIKDSEETQENDIEERTSVNTDELKLENDSLKEENTILRQENNRLEEEIKTLNKELEEQKLRIEGLTKLELLLKIKENLKNKNVEITTEKNKLEEEIKTVENSTEKIVVENENKVENKKPQNKRLNPFFRRFF